MPATGGPNNITSATPGSPVVAINPGQFGAFITNPLTAGDQGLPVAEPLMVNEVGPATLSASGTTIALQPGDTFHPFAQNSTVPVTVVARSPLHRYSVSQWI